MLLGRVHGAHVGYRDPQTNLHVEFVCSEPAGGGVVGLLQLLLAQSSRK